MYSYIVGQDAYLLVFIFSTWSSEGSGETAQLSSLICAFTALQCDKLQSLFNINYAMWNLVS